MKAKKPTKAQIKKFYEFCQKYANGEFHWTKPLKNVGTLIVDVNCYGVVDFTGRGIDVNLMDKVEYDYVRNWYIDYDKGMQYLDSIFYETFEGDAPDDICGTIADEINDLDPIKDFSWVFNHVPSGSFHIEGGNILNDFEAFETALLKGLANEQPSVKSTVTLNDNYNAIINKGQSQIRVGCQNIEIGKIRELVKVYDKLNQ